MNTFIRIKKLVYILLLLSPATLLASGWQYSITPYLWLPNIEGNVNYASDSGSNTKPSVGVGPNNYLQSLDMALMLTADIRIRPLVIYDGCDIS